MANSNLGPAIVLLFVGVLAGMQLQKFVWQLRPRRRRNWNDRRGKVLPFQPRHLTSRSLAP
jgi:hypothetical protein